MRAAVLSNTTGRLKLRLHPRALSSMLPRPCHRSGLSSYQDLTVFACALCMLMVMCIVPHAQGAPSCTPISGTSSDSGCVVHSNFGFGHDSADHATLAHPDGHALTPEEEAQLPPRFQPTRFPEHHHDHMSMSEQKPGGSHHSQTEKPLPPKH